MILLTDSTALWRIRCVNDHVAAGLNQQQLSWYRERRQQEEGKTLILKIKTRISDITLASLSSYLRYNDRPSNIRHPPHVPTRNKRIKKTRANRAWKDETDEHDGCEDAYAENDSVELLQHIW